LAIVAVEEKEPADVNFESDQQTSFLEVNSDSKEIKWFGDIMHQVEIIG
jgi:hypothetical protein